MINIYGICNNIWPKIDSCNVLKTSDTDSHSIKKKKNFSDLFG